MGPEIRCAPVLGNEVMSVFRGSDTFGSDSGWKWWVANPPVYWIPLGFLTLCVSCGLGHSPDDILQETVTLGKPILDAINDYHHRNGHFPENLKDATPVSTSTRYGEFKYLVWTGRQRFSLSLGDYARRGYCVIYDFTSKRWRLDT